MYSNESHSRYLRHEHHATKRRHSENEFKEVVLYRASAEGGAFRATKSACPDLGTPFLREPITTMGHTQGIDFSASSDTSSHRPLH